MSSHEYPCKWMQASDALLSDLFHKLKEDPNSLTTKECLRPVFKWLKLGSKHFSPESAFSFAEWIVQLSVHGDSAIGVSKALPQLQPAYIFNTLVTMSQRNNSAPSARRAYERMRFHGYTPDIFTMTALLDVVGRNGDVAGAYEIYRHMYESQHCLPNVVTYCTLIRMTAKLAPPNTGPNQVRSLLADARDLASRRNGSQVSDQDGVVDSSIYNAALAAAVKFMDTDLLLDVLQMMRPEEKPLGELSLPQLTYEIICKFTIKHRDLSGAAAVSDDDILQTFLQRDALTLEDIAEVKLHITNRQQRVGNDEGGEQPITDAMSGAHGDTHTGIALATAKAPAKQQQQLSSPYVQNMSYLGISSPESLRATVLKHDLTRLAQRLLLPDDEEGPVLSAAGATGGTALTESDFATLIHQCRKRKWPEQVTSVLAFMNTLCLEGFRDIGVSAEPTLCPTMVTVEACMEAYFSGAACEAAWDLLLQVKSCIEAEINGTEEEFSKGNALRISAKEGIMNFSNKFPRLMISGFIGCMHFEYAMRAYFMFRHFAVDAPPKDLVLCLMRSAGRKGQSIQGAITILTDLLKGCSLCVDPACTFQMEPAHRRRISQVQTFSERPVDVSLHTMWTTCATQRRGDADLSWADFEDFLNTLLRSCALLSGSAVFAHVVSYFLNVAVDVHVCRPYFLGTDTGSSSATEWRGMCPEEANCIVYMAYLSDCIRGLLSRWNSHFLITAVMSVCSESVNPSEVCGCLLTLQRQGVLPAISCIHSLALDALGHSWAPDKKAAVVFETAKGQDSLPFRSFVYIGVLKYLDSRESFFDALVCGLLESDANQSRQSLDGLLVDMNSVSWLDEMLRPFVGESVPGKDGEELVSCKDPLLRGPLAAINEIADVNLNAENTDSLLVPFNAFRLRGQLFLQHCYARFANVKTKMGKTVLDKDLALVLESQFSSFPSLWIFLCTTLLPQIHIIGAKSDEKIVIRFLSFLLGIMSKRLLELSLDGSTKRAATGYVEDVQSEGKPTKQGKCSDSGLMLAEFVRTSPLCEGFPSLLGASVLQMMETAGDIGRSPFEHVKAVHKAVGILSFSNVCDSVCMYISKHVASQEDCRPFKLGQLVDFAICYKEEVLSRIDTHLLERQMAAHLWEEALFYKHIVEYLSSIHVQPKSFDAAAEMNLPEEMWSSAVRIARAVSQERNSVAAVAIESISESTAVDVLHKSNGHEATIHDLLIKMLHKFHPTTLSGSKSATSAMARKDDIEAVLEAYGHCSKGDPHSSIDGTTSGEYAHAAVKAKEKNEKSMSEGQREAAYYSLPLPRERVVIVDDIISVIIASQYLGIHNTEDTIAIDVEWKPITSIVDFNLCSLLQISCRSHVFLFDLTVLEASFCGRSAENIAQYGDTRLRYGKLIAELFSSPKVLKLGFGLQGDLERLRESFPDSSYFQEINNTIDLNGKWGELRKFENPYDVPPGTGTKSGSKSLSTMLYCVCGEKLNKDMQVSDWEVRPLDQKQIDYAATDSYCLLVIWDSLKQQRLLS